MPCLFSVSSVSLSLPLCCPSAAHPKVRSDCCCAKSQQGKPTATHHLTLNSPIKNASQTPHLRHAHQVFDKNTRSAGVSTQKDEQIVDFFWETGRLPTEEEVKELVSKESEIVSAQDDVKALDPDPSRKYRRFPAEEEIVDFDSKEFWRTPIKGQVEAVGYADGVSKFVSAEMEDVDSKENGEVPEKNRLNFSDCSKNCGSFIARGEVKAANFGDNGRIPLKDQIEILGSFRKKNRMPTKKEENLYSNEGSSAPNIPDADNGKNGIGIPAEFIDFAEKTNRLTVQEQEVSASVGIGKLHFLDVVDRLQRFPSGEKIDILHFFRKNGNAPTVADVNNLLIALIKSDKHEHAVDIFKELSLYEISPDKTTFSIMLQCYCWKNDLTAARKALDRMIEKGFAPNVITYTYLIDCFCKRGKMQKAYEIFDIMYQTGCEPNIQTYNCLINGLCFVGRVEEANDFLNKIKNSSKKPDIYTFTVVIDGFCRVGRADKGYELLEDAVRMGLHPTVVTFNALFNGFCKEGRPLEGINLLKKMKEMGCPPNFIVYSTLLHGLLKWDEVKAALKIYKEMSAVGIKASDRSSNCLLKALCEKMLSSTDRSLLNDTEELLKSMKEMGIFPTQYTYCLIVQALSSRGKTDTALANLYEMIGIGYRPRATTFNGVIRALCSEGRPNEAWLVLFQMIQQRLYPSKNSYGLIFDVFNLQGRMLDACKVQALTVKRGIKFPH